MNDVRIARITGAFGLACVALTFGQFPLWLGNSPSVYDGSGLARARSETEWIGTLFFGAALGWVAVTVVANGLEGGAFLASAAWATFDSGVLPRWTGWIAAVATALCVASVPAMYGGPADPTGFYNAGGWGPAIVAHFPPMIWFVGT